MKVLVTGANGFVGQELVRRLLADSTVLGRPLSRLSLIDTSFGEKTSDPRVRYVEGDIAEHTLLRRTLVGGVDLVFHLASVPGGLAERDYGLGERVNLCATLELFNQLREQSTAARVVFASSIAVYGSELGEQVDEATRENPNLSYGAQKVIGETLLRDFSRRGWIDGLSLRLPAIVSRPRGPSGLLSAYMSDIQHALAAGEHYVCPVSPSARSWWMSAKCCVDNLLHAAILETERADPRRTYLLPALHFSVGELVDALARRFGDDRLALITYEPVEELEASFGRYPPLSTPSAKAAGFKDDGSVDLLVSRGLGLEI